MQESAEGERVQQSAKGTTIGQGRGESTTSGRGRERVRRPREKREYGQGRRESTTIGRGREGTAISVHT